MQIDQSIIATCREMACFYERPFSRLPVVEQLHIARKIIEAGKLEAEIWVSEDGVKTLQKMIHLSAVGDGNSLLALFASFLLRSTEAERIYTESMEAQ